MLILESEIVMNNKNVGIKHNRGRPPGFKLSEGSKEKIRQSRFGKHHSEETRDKISQSLISYFRRRESLADSIRYEYKHFPQYVDEWLTDHKELLDDMDTVMTEKKLTFLKQLELCFGNEIDRFGHNATPEFFLMLKEELLELGLSDELKQLYLLVG